MITKAIKFATLKHEGQKRKGSDLPYIVHPIEVMWLLENDNSTEELVVAGLLHDTLEDTRATEKEIEELFGEYVLSIVQSATEDKSKTWLDRKQHTINNTKNLSFEQKMLQGADKVSNLNSMLEDYEELGEKLWDRFSGTKENIVWYYNEIFKELSSLRGTKLYGKYSNLIKRLNAI